MNPKQRAAEASIQFLRDGMTIGIGTGSTADCFIVALARALSEGRLKDVQGIPTSKQSEQRARELGIPLTTLAEHPLLEVTVDGADEVGPDLALIKGLGGALLREKIVAQNTRQLIIIADTSKSVPVLGTRSPLPVEVIPFAHEAQAQFLRAQGAAPTLRTKPDGSPFLTDNGNYIYDCRFGSIPDPLSLEVALSRRAGIVETGLFIGMAQIALIADDQGVEIRRR